MKPGIRVSAYGLAVALVAGAAWAVGAAVGPVAPAPANSDHSMGAPMEMPAGGLSGLAVAANGYRLELGSDSMVAGAFTPFRFRIVGPDGSAVTRFDEEFGKRLHLVLVRRDTSGYQHLHPDLSADGTWSAALTLPSPGSYRVFTDFTPQGGTRTVLGADVQVAGDYRPLRHDHPTRASTVDGYQVRLDGELTPGHDAELTATVTRDGRPVTDLQPYLGAYGHLVALRAADLGYLHVHPLSEATATAGPSVRFGLDVPTPGRYRLFFDFQHEGRVRTAEFTVDTEEQS
jgi:hypothetical protein